MDYAVKSGFYLIGWISFRCTGSFVCFFFVQFSFLIKHISCLINIFKDLNCLSCSRAFTHLSHSQSLRGKVRSTVFSFARELDNLLKQLKLKRLRILRLYENYILVVGYGKLILLLTIGDQKVVTISVGTRFVLFSLNFYIRRIERKRKQDRLLTYFFFAESSCEDWSPFQKKKKKKKKRIKSETFS